MTFGHLTAGYFTAVALETRWRRSYIDPSSIPVLQAASVIFAVAPDFDALPSWLRGQKAHHTFPLLHSFFPYVFIVLPLAALLFFRHRPLLAWLITLYALGGVNHILLDFISHGVAWFYPLDKRIYTLHGIFVPPDSPGSTVFQPFLLLELATNVFMAHYILRRSKPRPAFMKSISLSCAVLITFLLAASVVRLWHR